MERITYQISLDLHKNGVQRTLQGFETGDSKSRRVDITLREGDNPYVLPQNGVGASLYVTLPNGTQNIEACTIYNGRFICDLTSEDYAMEGMVSCQLKVYSTINEGQVIVAPRFQLEVLESDISDSEAIESSTYTSLTEALMKANYVYNNGRILSISWDENLTLTVVYGMVADYDSTVEYEANEKCYYNGKVWKCLTTCTDVTPVEGVYWTELPIDEGRIVYETDVFADYISTHVLSSEWGRITGTLSDQTDLKNALDAKMNSANPTGTGALSVNRYGTVGENSVSIGDSNRASGEASVALGYMNVASGDYSFSVGSDCEATGLNSTAIGNSASAGAMNAVAIGTYVEANYANQIVVGTHNANISNSAFEIGNGSVGSPSNAFRVTKDGKVYASNEIHTLDGSNIVSDGEVKDGLGNVLSNKQNLLVSGTNIKTINNESILGSGNINIQGGGSDKMDKVNPVGTGSLSMNRAPSSDVGEKSATLNDRNTASGDESTAIGYITNALGDSSFSTGQMTDALGDCSFTSGGGTKAIGPRSKASGRNTWAFGAESSSNGVAINASFPYIVPTATITVNSIDYDDKEAICSLSAEDDAFAEAAILSIENAGVERKYAITSISGTSVTLKWSGVSSYLSVGMTVQPSDYRIDETENIAIGVASTTNGKGTIAGSDNQMAEGKYNVPDFDGEYAHVIGGGSSHSNRKNIFTVDWNGNLEVDGNITDGNGTSLSAKMDKANPVGTGSLSMNRLGGSTVGAYSVTLGGGEDVERTFYGETKQITFVSQDTTNHTVSFKTNATSLAVGATDQRIVISDGTNEYTLPIMSQTWDSTSPVGYVMVLDNSAHDYTFDAQTTYTAEKSYGSWKCIATGECSFAAGRGAQATYAGAIALGDGAIASEDNAVAIGHGIASGISSFAANYSKASAIGASAFGSSTASGNYSFAIGNSNTEASGNLSFAAGENTKASGNKSATFGQGTKATQNNSFAVGMNTTASGYHSFAEGEGGSASGGSGHKEGYYSVASGNYSHAENKGCTASGNASHAQGDTCQAKANASHAGGTNTLASSASQTAIGKFNVEDTQDTYGFIVGNGTANNARSNAFTVKWNGDATASGEIIDGYGNKLSEAGQTGLNKMDKADPTGTGVLSMNRKADSTVGDYSVALGRYCVAKKLGSFAEGLDTVSEGQGSHSEGYLTVAYGNHSHAEGTNGIAIGEGAHVEGNSGSSPIDLGANAKIRVTQKSTGTIVGTISGVSSLNSIKVGRVIRDDADNYFLIADVDDTTLTLKFGDASNSPYSVGQDITVYRLYANRTVAGYKSSHAEGTSTLALSVHQHVAGKYNVADSNDTYARITGNGTADNARSNAETLDWSGNLWVAGNVTDGSGNVLANKMDLPALPSTDGTYTLQVTISNGTPTFSWV